MTKWIVASLIVVSGALVFNGCTTLVSKKVKQQPKVLFLRAPGIHASDPLSIWIMNEDGTDQQQLTTAVSKKDDFNVAPCPDGNLLAIASYRDSDSMIADLYTGDLTVDETGKYQLVNPQRRTTFPKSDEWEPSWASDCQRIVYSSDRSGPSLLYVWDWASEAEAITAAPSAEPAWSPGSNRIVFARLQGNEYHLFLKDFGGPKG